MEYQILNRIQDPKDLKKLSMNEIICLADEVRQRIIQVMAEKGGHLASSLGTVELLVALHKVFSSPEDKFIFDVGHQAYPHKILTGRNKDFDTIRQYKGLCGFTHPKESPHDHFHAGHAGPALSQALGIAKNRELTNRQEHIITIMGDATLTCGLALEALNNIPRNLRRFIVILNDNAMSISQNVGAMPHILSRLLNNPTVNKFYDEVENFLSKIPSYGAALAKQGQKAKASLNHLISDASYFEQHHLNYVGPIDGHDITKLIDVFEALKDVQKPVIVHVLTNKGQGLDAAVKNPVTYHGAKPFNPETGKFIKPPAKQPTFPQVFGKHLLKMASNDPSIVTVTPAMSQGSCLAELMKKFPNRCIDVGIAEGHSLTYSGGIAYGGNMKVVASIYSTFLHRALDNLFHDICLQELPVVLAIDRAGLSAADGATHHGVYDISFLKAMPNMVISQPRNGHLLKELLESAFQWGRPAAIRYPNIATEEEDKPLIHRPLGQGEVLVQGKEILIIGLGHMCQTALAVHEQLKDYGLSSTVLDPIFVKPLDQALLHKLLLTHNKLITIEEHSITGGLGATINHHLMVSGHTNVQVLNLGIPEIFVEYGSYKALIEELGLTPEKITQRIMEEFSLEKIGLVKVKQL